MTKKNIIPAILIALVIVFVIQNTQVVEIQFIAWKVSMSRAMMVLLTFLLGIIAGWLAKRTKHKG